MPDAWRQGYRRAKRQPERGEAWELLWSGDGTAGGDEISLEMDIAFPTHLECYVRLPGWHFQTPNFNSCGALGVGRQVTLGPIKVLPRLGAPYDFASLANMSRK